MDNGVSRKTETNILRKGVVFLFWLLSVRYHTIGQSLSYFLAVLGESFRKTSSFGGSFARRTTVGGDSSGSERIGVAVSAFAKAPSLGRRETNHGLNQEKWLRNRPGATFFEKLQVSVNHLS